MQATTILIEDLEMRIELKMIESKKLITIKSLFGKEKPKRKCAYFTEKTIPIWKEMCHAGFVDENFMRLPKLTYQLAAYLISRFAEILGIRNIWAEIERFWGIKNLAQEKNKYLDRGILPHGHEEIDLIFASFKIL